MPSEYVLSFEDYSTEKSTMRVVIDQLTAGNLAATEALLATLLSSIQAITLGAVRTETVKLRVDDVDAAAVTDPLAQREIKALVSYHDDTTGKKYRIEIPTLDLVTIGMVAGSDLVNLADAQAAAFVAAFEAVAKDPDTGLNTVTVDTIRFVGRNS